MGPAVAHRAPSSKVSGQRLCLSWHETEESCRGEERGPAASSQAEDQGTAEVTEQRAQVWPLHHLWQTGRPYRASALAKSTNLSCRPETRAKLRSPALPTAAHGCGAGSA